MIRFAHHRLDYFIHQWGLEEQRLHGRVHQTTTINHWAYFYND